MWVYANDVRILMLTLIHLVIDFCYFYIPIHDLCMVTVLFE